MIEGLAFGLTLLLCWTVLIRTLRAAAIETYALPVSPRIFEVLFVLGMGISFGLAGTMYQRRIIRGARKE